LFGTVSHRAVRTDGNNPGRRVLHAGRCAYWRPTRSVASSCVSPSSAWTGTRTQGQSRKPGNEWATEGAEPCCPLRWSAEPWFGRICAHIGACRGLPRTRQTAMVRKGSPVRVRQRALRTLLQYGLLVSGAAPLTPSWWLRARRGRMWPARRKGAGRPAVAQRLCRRTKTNPTAAPTASASSASMSAVSVAMRLMPKTTHRTAPSESAALTRSSRPASGSRNSDSAGPMGSSSAITGTWTRKTEPHQKR
jgi:hypothetical protein